MLTNNYYAYKKLMFSGDSSYNGTHIETIYIYPVTGTRLGSNGSSTRVNPANATKGDLGYWLNKARCGTFPTSSMASDTDASFGVYFGTGTTPATLADIKMGSPIESGLTITNPTRYVFSDNGTGKWTYSASYVLTNTTAEDLHIYEIGIVTPIGANSQYFPTLMEHTVLTEPITVPAGGAKLVTLTLTQNNVLNVE